MEWRPIEEAPTDGKAEVLLWIRQNGSSPEPGDSYPMVAALLDVDPTLVILDDGVTYYLHENGEWCDFWMAIEPPLT